jgi:hypothetical protein
MSLFVAAVVVYGFSHTIDHNLIHPNPAPPWVLYLHAPVFCAWVLFFILQPSLVRTRNVRIHRTLGWFGAALAALMLVLGFLTATGMDRVAFQKSHNMAAPSFLIVQVMDLLCFAVPFALAIYWRKKPEFHRRLMLVATCALTDAAFGRFPWLPLVFAPAGLDTLILFGVVRDLIVDRRVHKVYLYALPALIVCQVVAMQTFVHQSAWWLRIAIPLLR